MDPSEGRGGKPWEEIEVKVTVERGMEVREGIDVEVCETKLVEAWKATEVEARVEIQVDGC